MHPSSFCRSRSHAQPRVDFNQSAAPESALFSLEYHAFLALFYNTLQGDYQLQSQQITNLLLL